MSIPPDRTPPELAIALARSVLQHRFDTTDPDVIAVLRCLDGWTVEQIATAR